MQDTIKKLKFRGTAIVLYAPEELQQQFIAFGFKTGFEKGIKSANTLIFINDKKKLISFLENQLSLIEPDSVLWFAYPKGTSKIKTDINRDIIRTTGEEYAITTVTAVSINDTWSALRFRPVDKVGT